MRFLFGSFVRNFREPEKRQRMEFMHTLRNHRKSCGPQRFKEVPQKDWGLDQLGNYARAQCAAIEKAERSLAADYWCLGAALTLTRKNFSHGQWGKCLAELGVEKTRASKACAIYRSFQDVTLVKKMSVEEAYRRRHRRARTSHPRRRSRNHARHSLSAWLSDICSETDFAFEEIDRAHPDTVATLLPAVSAAIDQLTKLRDHIQQRLDAP